MEQSLKPGLMMEKREQVTANNTANKFASGTIEVYATPALIGLMEFASYSCVQSYLNEGYTTVGIRLDVKHLAATPIGLVVTAKSELIQVDGKRLVFKVEAFDNREKVGEGIHERFIVNAARFLDKAAEKRS